MHVSLHLARQCSLRCTSCGGAPHPQEAMSVHTARAAVEFVFRELGDAEVTISFSGGEPLLRPWLLEAVVERAHQLGGGRDAPRVRFAVTSRGPQLSAGMARLLTAERFDILLSLDESSRGHPRRRVAGASSRRVPLTLPAGLDRLLRINPRLTVRSLVTPAGCSNLLEGVELLLDRHIQSLMLVPERGAAWDRRSFAQLARSYRAVAELWASRHREGRPPVIDAIDDRVLARPGVEGDREPCGAPRSEIAVAPDGRLYSCPRMLITGPLHGGKALGHVERGWYPRARERAARLSRQPRAACNGCDVMHACTVRHACLAAGAVNRLFGFSCAHERMLLPIVRHAARPLLREKNGSLLRKLAQPSRAPTPATQRP